jgi:6-pyruvoyltetrahydropterin/6-carboxytetrahydropterin synthase
MEITKIFEFDSAHKLDWHSGKCKNLHGHTYKLEVTISGKLNKNGIVMDFSDLKKIVNECIIDKFDHKFLNDTFENPTAETMTVVFFQLILEKLPEDITLKEVKLWETPTSFATFKGE